MASSPDTIRILISTDNHVGYNERDPNRKDDSWKTFHEIMCLAKERDVDMVLLAGDLFHDNKPSRKAMYQVMRSIRMNCFGDKPCEIELLSDPSENFQGAFGHANYEDPDINVAVPIFSIHGNHDDPSGDGYLAALDLLQVAGLLNYYGRAPESDNIAVKPVLLQKGRTKLALYGLSNVRDERLFRTFRDGKVKFFQPKTHKDEWFNIMSVHQNHHAYTETGFLPESFLPSFVDLVVWGHEHECLIEPRYNPDTGFHVIQPGSSVATSLVPGEAVTKQVTILSVTGKSFTSEPIRLKTVRPFVFKEIVLAEEKGLKDVWKLDDNRVLITRHLTKIVHELIRQAKAEWQAQERQSGGPVGDPPAPLVRLRVEYSAPEGGHFDCENPQRISNRFIDEVANVNDVIQFHRKKTFKPRKSKDMVSAPDAEAIAQLSADTVRVQQLVQQFLVAQSLTILPQNSFGDAVSQFVEKDDKHAMETFVSESLADQTNYLLQSHDADDEIDITNAMEEHRARLEELFAQGLAIETRSSRSAQPALDDDDMLNGSSDPIDDLAVPPPPPVTRTQTTRARGSAGRARARASTGTARTVRSAPDSLAVDATANEPVVLDDSPDEDSQSLFVPPPRTSARAAARRTAAASVVSAPSAIPDPGVRAGARSRASQPSPRASSTRAGRAGRAGRASRTAASSGTAGRTAPFADGFDDDDDDDDAFDTPASSVPSTRSRRLR